MTYQFLDGKNTFYEPPDLNAKKGDELKPTGFSTEINYYVLPDCEEKLKLNFGVYLMLCGTSSTATIDQWKSWLVTWTCLLTPTIANELSETQYQSREISSADIESLSKKMDELNSALHSKKTGLLVKSATEVGNFIKLRNLPFLNEDADIAKGKGNFSIRLLYCYYSLMLLLAGKRIDKDLLEITLKFPEALREQAGIAEASAFLEGDLRVQDESYAQLKTAWNELEHFKSKIFIEYSYYNSFESNFLQRIIWTTMRKLQDHGTNKALIIYNFLKSNSSALIDPELRSSILIYRNRFKQTKNISECLFPYVKVIYGEYLFSQEGAELLYQRAKNHQPKKKSSDIFGHPHSQTWN